MTHPGTPAAARPVARATGTASLPALLDAQAQARPDAPALLHKQHGIWRRWSWRDAAGEAARLAAGLATRGVAAGEAVVIAGSDRPRLLLAALACQRLGAVPVLVPQAGAGVPLASALAEHRPRLVVAAGEHEVHAVLAVRDGLAPAPVVLCDDMRGLTGLRADWLAPLDTALGGTPPAPPAAEAATAAIVYAADAAGGFRPVVLTHAGLIADATARIDACRLTPRDRGFVAVPLGWGPAFLLGPVQALLAGFALAFPESDATVLGDLRDAGPTLLFGPSLLFRRLRQMAFLRTAEAPWPWRAALRDSFGFGPDSAARPGLAARAVRASARDRLGLAALRSAVSFGDAVPPQIAGFFDRLDVTVHPFATATFPQPAPDRIATAEALLRGGMYVAHAYVVANRHGGDGALLALDTEAVAQWARLQGVAVRSTVELVQHDSVAALLAREIAALGGAVPRIDSFLIAPHGFAPVSGEITAEGLLQRERIEQLHAAALEDLRAGAGLPVTAPASARPASQRAPAHTVRSTAADGATV